MCWSFQAEDKPISPAQAFTLSNNANILIAIMLHKEAFTVTVISTLSYVQAPARYDVVRFVVMPIIGIFEDMISSNVLLLNANAI